MSFEMLMGTFGIGTTAMLAIMGSRQWRMGYRIAGGVSLVIAAGLAAFLIAWLLKSVV